MSTDSDESDVIPECIQSEATDIIGNLLPERSKEAIKFSIFVFFHYCKINKTSSINAVNPMVDRIMDDESVEGVIMTNKEGAPILTNVSLTSATSYGRPLNRFATMTTASIKELDIFDEVLAVRLVTIKKEIMLAPNNEFNVIVVQHARRKSKQQQDK